MLEKMYHPKKEEEEKKYSFLNKSEKDLLNFGKRTIGYQNENFLEELENHEEILSFETSKHNIYNPLDSILNENKKSEVKEIKPQLPLSFNLDFESFINHLDKTEKTNEDKKILTERDQKLVSFIEKKTGFDGSIINSLKKFSNDSMNNSKSTKMPQKMNKNNEISIKPEKIESFLKKKLKPPTHKLSTKNANDNENIKITKNFGLKKKFKKKSSSSNNTSSYKTSEKKLEFLNFFNKNFLDASNNTSGEKLMKKEFFYKKRNEIKTGKKNNSVLLGIDKRKSSSVLKKYSQKQELINKRFLSLKKINFTVGGSFLAKKNTKRENNEKKFNESGGNKKKKQFCLSEKKNFKRKTSGEFYYLKTETNNFKKTNLKNYESFLLYEKHISIKKNFFKPILDKKKKNKNSSSNSKNILPIENKKGKKVNNISFSNSIEKRNS